MRPFHMYVITDIEYEYNTWTLYSVYAPYISEC